MQSQLRSDGIHLSSLFGLTHLIFWLSIQFYPGTLKLSPSDSTCGFLKSELNLCGVFVCIGTTRLGLIAFTNVTMCSANMWPLVWHCLNPPSTLFKAAC